MKINKETVTEYVADLAHQVKEEFYCTSEYLEFDEELNLILDWIDKNTIDKLKPIQNVYEKYKLFENEEDIFITNEKLQDLFAELWHAIKKTLINQ